MKSQKRGQILLNLANGAANKAEHSSFISPQKKKNRRDVLHSKDSNVISYLHPTMRNPSTNKQNQITPSNTKAPKYFNKHKYVQLDDSDDNLSKDGAPSPLQDAVQSLDLHMLPKQSSASKCQWFLKSMERPANYQPRALFTTKEIPIDHLKEFEKTPDLDGVYEFDERDDYVIQPLETMAIFQPIPTANSNDRSEVQDVVDRCTKAPETKDVEQECESNPESSKSNDSEATAPETKDVEQECESNPESSKSNESEATAEGSDPEWEEDESETTETTNMSIDDPVPKDVQRSTGHPGSESTGNEKKNKRKQQKRDLSKSMSINDSEPNEVQRSTVHPGSQNIVNDKKNKQKQQKRDLSKDENLKFSKRSKHIWNREDWCIFCQDFVSNHFSRHLTRQHKDEPQVQNIMKLPKGKVKNNLYAALRNAGNFKLMTEKKIFIPARRPDEKESNHTTTEDFCPCPYCLAILKKTTLYRHIPKCKSRPENYDNNSKQNPVGASHTLLAMHYGNHGSFLVNSRLKNEVFPIMAADDISLAAKTDPLICIYGEAYIGKHKRIQMRNKVSNEIREFGRLLITMKSFTNVTCMMDVLDPKLFTDVVNAVKIISGYDVVTKSFKAPSLALHMRTNLDHLCATGEKVVLQKNPCFSFENADLKLKEIKHFRKLICNHFSEEISSLALKNLNEKKWQKRAAIPRTTDIEKFNNYLKKEAEEAYLKLERDVNNEYYYSKLVKTTLALTVLINRKRIGEVQFLTIETYNRDYSGINLEEFQKSLSKYELDLATKFKRVVTCGKGSRPVPILFPKKIENYIDRILLVRKEGRFVSGKNDDVKFVNESNPYVFALPDTDHWISGYHVIKKLAKECGLENPDLMTSTRFRKHLATIMQLLNYERDEMEQIAKFLGHTMKTHEEFYRLSEDVYQTSKVAKVLMIMDEGKGEQYRGINLKDLELNCDLVDDVEEGNPDDIQSRSDSLSLDDANEPTNFEESTHTQTNMDAEESTSTEKNSRNFAAGVIVTSKGIRKRWTDRQKTQMKKYFRKHISDKKAPNKKICEEFLEKYKEMFEGRDWVTVKTFVYNCYKDA